MRTMPARAALLPLHGLRWAAVLCSLAIGPSLARGQAAPAIEEESPAVEAKPKFVRLARDERDVPQAMETAVAHYVSADGSTENPAVRVDLVAAIHIADQAYYAALNERFGHYDSVLYELVAEEGTRVPEGGGGPSLHPVGLLQNGMRNMLKLSYQLEEIDYQRDNFVHADMSPEQFEESMRDRRENFLTMFFRMLGQSIAQQSRGDFKGPSDAEMLRALLDRNNKLPLKRVLAAQFEDMESMLLSFNGPDGSTIITERNKVALAKLAERIEAGDRRLAIFYGGGHMPDMHERLLADFGLRLDNTEWLVAWDLSEPEPKQRGGREQKSSLPARPTPRK